MTGKNKGISNLIRGLLRYDCGALSLETSQVSPSEQFTVARGDKSGGR